MNIDSQTKVLAAGFIILRKDDRPTPRIKQNTGNGGWKTYRKYSSKAARDRAFKELMKEDKIIDD